jgi:hypothetical protein
MGQNPLSYYLIYNYNMCVHLSVRPTTIPRFNWLAEPARTVELRDRKSAWTVGFCKLKIPHKKSFVPLAASCVKTKARTVGFRDRKPARTVGFCKQKIPHKKSFVPLAALCVKTKRRNLQCMYLEGQVFTGASALSMLRSYDRSYWMGVLSVGREEKYMGNCWEFMREFMKQWWMGIVADGN